VIEIKESQPKAKLTQLEIN